MKGIILAGGGGTRLWPLSREDFPKQFLSFGTGLSLLQTTVGRLIRLPFIDDLIVSTNHHHLALVEQQLEKINALKKVKILVEPHRRNTGPAIGLAVKYLETFCNAQSSEPVLVLPSDHLIEPEAIFINALEEIQGVARGDRLITFGIRPTKPETGFGYIQIGRKFDSLTYESKGFIEKPDREKAQRYIENPNFFWNSGMFMFSIRTFWDQAKQHCPALYTLFSGTYSEILGRFGQMPDVSIDYALMEKSEKILVCPLAVCWSDVGSWDSVYEALEKDHGQNVKVGNIVDVDTNSCMIIGGKRLICTLGVRDLLIVETEDAVFISKRGESQRVKGIVQELIRRGGKDQLMPAERSEGEAPSAL